MLSTAAQNSLNASDAQPRTSGNIFVKKIWLPKLLYEALPYFYLLAGTAAFLATMYIGAWYWVVPHYLLFSAACIHLGLFIWRRRRRHRRLRSGEG